MKAVLETAVVGANFKICFGFDITSVTLLTVGTVGNFLTFNFLSSFHYNVGFSELFRNGSGGGVGTGARVGVTGAPVMELIAFLNAIMFESFCDCETSAQL